LDMWEPCTCGACELDPIRHAPECKSLIHEVLRYPVRMAERDLVVNQSGERKLSAQYAGWKLVQNGQRWYRIKDLCRDCIGKQEQSQAFRRDYLQACKKARGQDDQTYSQMLAEQSLL
jgi:hypothetical protein